MRRIERVPIPEDARRREIRAYLFWSRRAIAAGAGLLAAAQSGDVAEGERMSDQLDTSTAQARYAARRYGLRECGA